VTNNRSDFLFCTHKNRCMRRVIIIVPSVTSVRQRELFAAALQHIGARDLTNTVLRLNMREIGLSVQSTPCHKTKNEAIRARPKSRVRTRDKKVFLR